MREHRMEYVVSVFTCDQKKKKENSCHTVRLRKRTPWQLNLLSVIILLFLIQWSRKYLVQRLKWLKKGLTKISCNRMIWHEKRKCAIVFRVTRQRLSFGSAIAVIPKWANLKYIHERRYYKEIWLPFKIEWFLTQCGSAKISFWRCTVSTKSETQYSSSVSFDQKLLCSDEVPHVFPFMGTPYQCLWVLRNLVSCLFFFLQTSSFNCGKTVRIFSSRHFSAQVHLIRTWQCLPYKERGFVYWNSHVWRIYLPVLPFGMRLSCFEGTPCSSLSWQAREYS